MKLRWRYGQHDKGKIGKNAEDNKYSLDELADQALAEAVTKMREYLEKKVGR